MSRHAVFLEPVEVRDHLDKVVFHARAGEVLELRDDQILRWEKRGRIRTFDVRREATKWARAHYGNGDPSQALAEEAESPEPVEQLDIAADDRAFEE